LEGVLKIHCIIIIHQKEEVKTEGWKFIYTIAFNKRNDSYNPWLTDEKRGDRHYATT
jgi:hypothetical protein